MDCTHGVRSEPKEVPNTSKKGLVGCHERSSDDAQLGQITKSAKNSVQKLGKFTHHTNGCNSLTDFENKDAITGNGNDVNLLKIREITFT